RYAPANITAGKGFWAARDNDRAGAWLQLSLPHAVTFDLIRLREELPFGVRIDDYEVDIWQGNGWKTIARHTCIGRQRLIKLDAPVTARKVRLRITKAAAAPIISEFSLFRLPDIVEEPTISRDANGLVTLKPSSRGQHLVYTLDGSPPGPNATSYDAPFPLPDGGTVKAIAINTATASASAVSSADFDVAPGRWAFTSTGDTPMGLLDGSGLRGQPGQALDIVIDLAQAYMLKGFTLTPLISYTTDYATAARIGPPAAFVAWVGDDGKTWGDPVATGEFANIAASRARQAVRFTAPHAARFLRLKLPNAVQDKPIIAVGAVGIITR
ncbi:MAG: discoidin domain-containing protein, partial [Asticcacaulis sp.]|nr:discoidin domain-containing protein [Asticcacaulis sp.]